MRPRGVHTILLAAKAASVWARMIGVKFWCMAFSLWSVEDDASLRAAKRPLHRFATNCSLLR